MRFPGLVLPAVEQLLQCDSVDSVLAVISKYMPEWKSLFEGLRGKEKTPAQQEFRGHECPPNVSKSVLPVFTASFISPRREGSMGCTQMVGVSRNKKRVTMYVHLP